jgi:ABC-type multidrug transport system permease subunit
MRFLIVSAAKDLRRRLADRAGLALWLGIPLSIGVFMSLAFGREAPAPKARVLLVDEDDSLLGRLAAGASSGQGADYLDIQRVSAEEGRRQMDAGRASALLILPKGLTSAVLNDTPATIKLVTNPAQSILPDVVRAGVETLVEGVFYLQRIFGPELTEFSSSRPSGQGVFSDASVARLAIGANQHVRVLESVLLPPVLSLETVGEHAQTQSVNFGTLLLPGVLFMSLLFVGRGFTDDLWVERERGTLTRALLTPHGAAVFLGGKVAAGAVFMAAVSAVGLAVAVLASGTPLARVPFAFLWCTFSGTVLICLFLAVQFLASSARGASLVTTMVLFPLMMLGGSFFPLEAMPAWMASIGRLTPNGQGVTQLRALLTGQTDATALAMAFGAMLLPAVAAFAVSARLLRGRFARGE